MSRCPQNRSTTNYFLGLNIIPSPLGGAPFNGFSPVQTLNNFKDSEQTSTRKILRNSWNNLYTQDQLNDRGRVITPFRAANNAGDYLGRRYYVCGGSSEINSGNPGTVGSHRNSLRGLRGLGSVNPSRCDGTNIPACSANSKWVYDSSDYITYKRQQAMNRNYNDLSNGGDKNNASYVAREARGKNRRAVP